MTAPPRISPGVVEFPRPNGTTLRVFDVGGVRVQTSVDTPADDAAAAELTARMHLVCSIPAAPARDTEWGGGQFDYVELAPGLRAALRVTSVGDVILLSPGGELTITAGACFLGLGLLEASARAAQIRKRHEQQAADRAAKPKRGGRR